MATVNSSRTVLHSCWPGITDDYNFLLEISHRYLDMYDYDVLVRLMTERLPLRTVRGRAHLDTSTSTMLAHMCSILSYCMQGFRMAEGRLLGRKVNCT